MELKDFIKGTISDISNAIVELNEDWSKRGMVVNPRNIKFHNEKLSRYEDGRYVQKINFNLVISASDRNETGGGIMINVLKAGLSNESKTNNTSSIEFSIPVVYPSGE